MPTIYRYKAFRVHFFTGEWREPPNVHVRRGEDNCKFWLEPVELAYNDGMKLHELTELQHVVEDHREEFLRKWYECIPKSS